MLGWGDYIGVLKSYRGLHEVHRDHRRFRDITPIYPHTECFLSGLGLYTGYKVFLGHVALNNAEPN